MAQMYEQVAASRLRMANQLSASNRYVAFLETALEARRSEVATALDSMQSLARVRTAGFRVLGLGFWLLRIASAASVSGAAAILSQYTAVGRRFSPLLISE